MTRWSISDALEFVSAHKRWAVDQVFISKECPNVDPASLKAALHSEECLVCGQRCNGESDVRATSPNIEKWACKDDVVSKSTEDLPLGG